VVLKTIVPVVGPLLKVPQSGSGPPVPEGGTQPPISFPSKAREINSEDTSKLNVVIPLLVVGSNSVQLVPTNAPV